MTLEKSSEPWPARLCVAWLSTRRAIRCRSICGKRSPHPAARRASARGSRWTNAPPARTGVCRRHRRRQGPGIAVNVTHGRAHCVGTEWYEQCRSSRQPLGSTNQYPQNLPGHSTDAIPASITRKANAPSLEFRNFGPNDKKAAIASRKRAHPEGFYGGNFPSQGNLSLADKKTKCAQQRYFADYLCGLPSHRLADSQKASAPDKVLAHPYMGYDDRVNCCRGARRPTQNEGSVHGRASRELRVNGTSRSQEKN